MKDKELNMEELENITGGYITGTYQGEAFTVRQNQEGMFVVTSAEGDYSDTPDDVRLYLQEYGLTDQQIDKIFSDIETDRQVIYGEVSHLFFNEQK